jgi:hypothetical protein
VDNPAPAAPGPPDGATAGTWPGAAAAAGLGGRERLAGAAAAAGLGGRERLAGGGGPPGGAAGGPPP